MIIAAASFQLIQEAGEGVLLLIDGLDESDFVRSRLTRTEVCNQLRLIADTLESLPVDLREPMSELDWAGWRQVARVLSAPDPAQTEVAWFAARSLAPAMLTWLRIYRHSEPGWFEFRPA